MFLSLSEDQSPDVLEAGAPAGVDQETGGDGLYVCLVQDLDQDVLQTSTHQLTDNITGANYHDVCLANVED